MRIGSTTGRAAAVGVLPSASRNLLSTSLNHAAAAVGTRAGSALRRAATGTAPGTRVSIALPLGIRRSLAAPSAATPGESGAAAPSVASAASRRVHFTPSLLHILPAVGEADFSGPDPPPKVGALALAYSPASVFTGAHKRIGFYFKLNVGVSLVLAGIGIVGVAGSLFAALVYKEPLWAGVLGGIGLATWLSLFVFKPLNRVQSALNASVHLNILVGRLEQQIHMCEKHDALEDIIECQTKVWEAIQQELAALVHLNQQESEA